MEYLKVLKHIKDREYSIEAIVPNEAYAVAYLRSRNLTHLLGSRYEFRKVSEVEILDDVIRLTNDLIERVPHLSVERVSTRSLSTKILRLDSRYQIRITVRLNATPSLQGHITKEFSTTLGATEVSLEYKTAWYRNLADHLKSKFVSKTMSYAGFYYPLYETNKNSLETQIDNLLDLWAL